MGRSKGLWVARRGYLRLLLGSHSLAFFPAQETFDLHVLMEAQTFH